MIVGLADEVQSLSDTEEYVKLLLFGDPGGGKTTFAAGAPSPIWFDFERSSDVLRHYPEYRNVPIVRPRSAKGTTERNRYSNYEKLIKEAVKSGLYKTIVIDTVGGQSEVSITQVCEEKSKEIPDWPEWRVSNDRQQDLFWYLQDAPINVIYISHAVVKKDEITSQIETRNNLPPALAAMINRCVNVTGFLEVRTSLKGEVSRRLLVQAGGKQQAKNRLRIKDAYIDEPSFAKLLTAEKETTPPDQLPEPKPN